MAHARRTLVAGASYWSVFPAAFTAASFNPNTAGELGSVTIGGRFHPIENAVGERIPMKYIADHENGALAETLLRDEVKERDVTLADVRRLRLARLGLRRALSVVDLTEPVPGSVLEGLLREGLAAYLPLRDLAATVHARGTHDGKSRPADGLLWESRQLDQPGMKCVMLFGDRVRGDTDLDVLEVLELDRGAGLRALRAAARLRRFTLPRALAI